MASKIQFSVRPRYTPGSPASVSEAVAEDVARSERRTHQDALEGAYGPQEGARAATLGLAHVVESLYETRTGWDVTDFLTGETYRRPFKWHQGDVVDFWDDVKGWVTGTVTRRTDGTMVEVQTRPNTPTEWHQPREILRDHLRITSSVRKLSAPLA